MSRSVDNHGGICSSSRSFVIQLELEKGSLSVEESTFSPTADREVHLIRWAERTAVDREKVLPYF